MKVYFYKSNLNIIQKMLVEYIQVAMLLRNWYDRFYILNYLAEMYVSGYYCMFYYKIDSQPSTEDFLFK